MRLNLLLDRFLDHITMYRLVLYYLLAMVGLALALSIFGLLPFSAPSLATTTLVAVAACTITNRLFARVFEQDASNLPSVQVGLHALAAQGRPVQLARYQEIKLRHFYHLYSNSLKA